MITKAILLMGGEGLRFGCATPKQFLNLSGKKIYLHTLETFLSFSDFKEIILVCPKKHQSVVTKEVKDPRIRIIEGGRTRQESSYLGLIACGNKTDAVVIHDAVRPFVSHKIIQDNLDALQKHPAVNTCIPSTDTIVHAKNGTKIDSIPLRSEYQRGQTPQSFHYPLILKAHQQNQRGNYSDDCSLVLTLGQNIHIVPGSENNIKITNELDLFLAEQLLRLKSSHSSTPSLPLNKKLFAITGGTGGIGAALARLLKKEGAMPLIISPSSSTYPVDLTNFSQTKRLFHTIYEQYGPLDGLINCVGLLKIKPFRSLSQKEIDTLIATNLHSLLYSCRCAHIKKGGHIINLSSSSFTRGRKNYALYSSAKAAVVNFTQGLAEEHPELHINVVVPQRTNTPMRKTNFPKESPSSLLPPQHVAQEIMCLLKQTGTTGTILYPNKFKNWYLGNSKAFAI
jgi:2-C-methyl-D-erythritol 4-phosphate cytidylyltransferase